MNKFAFTILTFLIFINTFSQNTIELSVCLDPNINFSNRESFESTLIKAQPLFADVLEQFDFQLVKSFAISDEKIAYLTSQAIQISGSDNAVQNLKNVFKIQGDLSDSKLQELANALEKIKEVKYCSFSSTIPIDPPYDIAPTTPNYIGNQTFLQANPGVNMTFAWNLGYYGQNIRLRDVEYGFNKNHEEFNDINTNLATGTTVHPDCTVAYTEHGTSTTGVIFGQTGSYGITGLAHGLSEFILYPEWTVEYGYNRNYAVSQAINNSLTGDIIVLEMQAYGATGSGNDFVPAEYNLELWNLIKAATDAGIVVVAAAGNGAQNLDGSLYATYMSRGNSGAILVGAGTSDTNHNRVSYSSYGTRVDVQGWGSSVFTSGYTTLPELANDFNQTYSNFSGTSSATAVVGGCVAVIQSYYHEQTGSYLTGIQINQILKATGIPQGTGTTGQIGPLPNMENAFLYIDNMLSMGEISDFSFQIFPNPTSDILYFQFTENSNTYHPVQIFNTLGQIVFEDEIQNSINIAQLTNGMYYVKIQNFNQSTTQKFIKK